MGAPGRFLGPRGSRLSHRAALKPVRKHFDRFGQRLHLGLKLTYAPLDRGYRRGP